MHINFSQGVFALWRQCVQRPQRGSGSPQVLLGWAGFHLGTFGHALCVTDRYTRSSRLNGSRKLLRGEKQFKDVNDQEIQPFFRKVVLLGSVRAGPGELGQRGPS